ncbi:ABC transporter substrate-binding protein [Aquitalea palustris]|uniref:ABC transporter substrate-binding protein n=1 Tax=Aquitalea palustris TaxID=2480983 RepID=A0A454JJ45_9NEIS|nr:ABC transporter substrate-binding protein [Aquitalea palustris]RMC98737.1 ABC transporter substrate-binding protein [Aquitalea palustris]
MKKLIACFLVLLGLSAHSMAATDNPADLVRDTSRQIMDVLKQENGKNTKQIRQQVEALAVPQFDFQRMTALAVGLGWRQASPAQQSALAQQFQTLLVRTYSTTMTRFKSAQIDIQPNVVLGNSGREATVKSTVTLPGNDKGPVAVDYTLYKTTQGWKVFNVSVEGASLVTVYRNQFNQEINKSGVDGLIKMLQDKNAALPAAK